MTTSRLRIGQLLVDARLISPDALADVLAAQRSDGRRLGSLLVERGHISEVQLTQILSHQLSVPWVTLHKIEFSRQLLNLVPRDLAERFCLLPIYVRRVRHHGDTLYIAMDDPTNEDALKACAEYAGIPVRPMIAPPSDIRSAIRAYYGIPAAETEPPPPPSGGAPVVKPTPVREAKVATEPHVDGPRARTLRSHLHDAPARPAADPPPTVREPSRPPPPLTEQRDLLVPLAEDRPAQPPAEVDLSSAPAAQPAPPREPHSPDPASDTPATPGAPDAAEAPDADARPSRPTPIDHGPVPIPSPRGKTPRMVALTLLDGTTITLPARPAKKHPETAHDRIAAPASEPPPPSEPPSSLTARDLVGALRAVAHGADASAVLGDDIRWETMFAALLSALLKKHVIADWEFVEELNKLHQR